MNRKAFFGGPDGGGKSTLALQIAGKAPVIHFGGPPLNKGEMWRRLAIAKSQEPPAVFDRCPAVAELVYGPQMASGLLLPEHRLLLSLWSIKHTPVFIYCRPPNEILLRQPILEKPHKPPDYCERLKERRKQVIARYDEIVSLVRYHYEVVRYDWSPSAMKEVERCLE